MLRREVATVVFVLTAVSLLLRPVLAQDINLKALEKIAGGTLGAYAVCLNSGQVLSFHSDAVFPMASVVKLIIGIAFLKQVDAGKFKLTDKITLTKKDVFEIGHSPLAESLPAPGLTLSMNDLMIAALSESDATAGEILLNRAGGPAVVQKMLDDLGCSDLKVRDSEARLMLIYGGVKNTHPAQWDAKTILALTGAVPKAERSRAARQFMLKPGNTATPHAMARLLTLLYQGKILKPETTTYLLKLMIETKTGPMRLKALLPGGALVGHKTGTWDTTDGVNGATNDVGIIYYPRNVRQVCIAVFIKGSNKELPEREHAIASFARQAYEMFSNSKNTSAD